jgi:hypothetical protein
MTVTSAYRSTSTIGGEDSGFAIVAAYSGMVASNPITLNVYEGVKPASRSASHRMTIDQARHLIADLTLAIKALEAV